MNPIGCIHANHLTLELENDIQSCTEFGPLAAMTDIIFFRLLDSVTISEAHRLA